MKKDFGLSLLLMNVHRRYHYLLQTNYEVNGNSTGRTEAITFTESKNIYLLYMRVKATVL